GVPGGARTVLAAGDSLLAADLLPGEFCRASGEGWGGPADRSAGRPGRGHLARLRTVWDDAEWLEFCRWFEQYATDGESPA
ncbi:hypothetical protein AB0R11_29115, partial [Streptomyces fradiae]